jgi:hypothetical protein
MLFGLGCKSLTGNLYNLKKDIISSLISIINPGKTNFNDSESYVSPDNLTELSEVNNINILSFLSPPLRNKTDPLKDVIIGNDDMFSGEFIKGKKATSKPISRFYLNYCFYIYFFLENYKLHKFIKTHLPSSFSENGSFYSHEIQSNSLSMNELPGNSNFSSSLLMNDLDSFLASYSFSNENISYILNNSNSTLSPLKKFSSNDDSTSNTNSKITEELNILLALSSFIF